MYRDRRCTLKPADLDHAVILVGWGTDKVSGEDYWVVKNSWSKVRAPLVVLVILLTVCERADASFGGVQLRAQRALFV